MVKKLQLCYNMRLYENPPVSPLPKGGKGGFSCFVVAASHMDQIDEHNRGKRNRALPPATASRGKLFKNLHDTGFARKTEKIIE